MSNQIRYSGLVADASEALGRQGADKTVLVIQKRSDLRHKLRAALFGHVPQIVEIVQESREGLGARQPRGLAVTVSKAALLPSGARIKLGKRHDGIACFAHRGDKVFYGFRLEPSAELLLPRQEPARAPLEPSPLLFRDARGQERVNGLSREILHARVRLGQLAPAARFLVAAGPAAIIVLSREKIADALRDLIRIAPAVD